MIRLSPKILLRKERYKLLDHLILVGIGSFFVTEGTNRELIDICENLQGFSVHLGLVAFLGYLVGNILLNLWFHRKHIFLLIKPHFVYVVQRRQIVVIVLLIIDHSAHEMVFEAELIILILLSNGQLWSLHLRIVIFKRRRNLLIVFLGSLILVSIFVFYHS